MKKSEYGKRVNMYIAYEMKLWLYFWINGFVITVSSIGVVQLNETPDSDTNFYSGYSNGCTFDLFIIRW